MVAFGGKDLRLPVSRSLISRSKSNCPRMTAPGVPSASGAKAGLTNKPTRCGTPRLRSPTAGSSGEGLLLQHWPFWGLRIVPPLIRRLLTEGLSVRILLAEPCLANAEAGNSASGPGSLSTHIADPMTRALLRPPSRLSHDAVRSRANRTRSHRPRTSTGSF